MGLPESKNRVGLGRALMKGRNIGAGTAQKGGKNRVKGTQSHYTTDFQKEFGSITEQAALDEFLATAELADTDFTAEKLNVKVIHTSQINPYLLTAEQQKQSLSKHSAHAKHLTVPRRPKWDSSTTPEQLDRLEKESFLHWRRGLAELQENKDLLMTPFERNLEMWRQLWRVIERSDLIVQIVDARNPLLFRCVDLEAYVKEVDSNKRNLLLINKADMMTEKQRKAWADYFDEHGIEYTFFSATLASQEQEMENDYEDEGSEKAEEEEEEDTEKHESSSSGLSASIQNMTLNPDDAAESIVSDSGSESGVPLTNPSPTQNELTFPSNSTYTAATVQEPRTRILPVDDLETLFLHHAPLTTTNNPTRTTIGLVGYPNVGKSSTINALIKAKKVSVSSTPGKTKHFQTIHLSPSVLLCDCPGLVFPNSATTKAELVCNGILPIDQLREFTGPAALVAQRIPHKFLEAVYGIKIPIRPLEEGGTGVPTGEELLNAYGRARGFTKTGVGEPDESRAARYILKDYVNGKLLFCAPPPREPEWDIHEFNHELYSEAHLPVKRQTGTYTQEIPEVMGDRDGVSIDLAPVEVGFKSADLDRRFFAQREGSGGHLRTPFARPQVTNGKGLSGRKARDLFAVENGLSKEEARRLLSGKKHFKGRKGM
ncbi:hypothetical protein EV426DRAFT_639930 [Tirmania nivea]|nr:hypothetical protein EV426DRAFT_639930 [Tirmania nivea]